MVKLISRQQKAANTRKARTKKKHKIIDGLKEALALRMTKSLDGWKVSENQVGPVDIISDAQSLKAAQAAFNKVYTPAPILTLCGQLEDAILLLETRISNAIAKINSLM